MRCCIKDLTASFLERLRINGTKTRLGKLATIDSNKAVDSLIVMDLEGTDLDENVVIPLP